MLAAYAAALLFVMFAAVGRGQEIRGYGLTGWPDGSCLVAAFIGTWCASIAAVLSLWMWKVL